MFPLQLSASDRTAKSPVPLRQPGAERLERKAALFYERGNHGGETMAFTATKFLAQTQNTSSPGIFRVGAGSTGLRHSEGQTLSAADMRQRVSRWGISDENDSVASASSVLTHMSSF